MSRILLLAIVLSILMVAGRTSVAGAIGSASPSLMVGSATQGLPDFSIVANPSTVTVPNGSGAEVNLTVTSLGGFQGVVKLDAYVVSALSQSFEGLYLFWEHSGPGVRLAPGGRANATLVVDGYQSHFRGVSQIWISAMAACLSHNTFLTVVQPPLPSLSSFRVVADPASLALHEGGSDSSRVNVQSLNGFSGVVSLIAIGEGGTFNPPNVTLFSGSTSSSELGFEEPPLGCPSSADILVVGSAGAISEASTIALTPAQPGLAKTSSVPNLVLSLLQSLRSNLLLISVVLGVISSGAVVTAVVLMKRSRREEVPGYHRGST